MRINFNASAVAANNSLTKNDNRLADSLARLSSGLKIVNAKDNPSGLAIAKRMNAQIEGIGVATNNANDAISVVEIADGALSEVHDILQRMNELCIKAATGVITEDDRKMVDEEAQQLKKELERIASDTEFNGQPILDGTFDLKGYTYDAAGGGVTDVKVAYYGDEVKPGEYSVSNLVIAFDGDGNFDPENSTITITGENGDVNAKITRVDDTIVSIEGDLKFQLKLDVKELERNPDTTASINNFTMDLVGFGAMDMQIGANQDQQMGIRIPKISNKNMGIASLDLTTEGNATKAIDQVKNAIQYISSARGGLGAYQNRLEHTISNLDVTSENMTSAYARIMDVDMAEEMTEYTTLQVLSQASTSMLAQANERPSQVLQLLQ